MSRPNRQKKFSQTAKQNNHDLLDDAELSGVSVTEISAEVELRTPVVAVSLPVHIGKFVVSFTIEVDNGDEVLSFVVS